MAEIGVAMVGAGFIAPVHVEALGRLGIPVRGILGVDDAESERMAGKLGLPRAYRSFDEVLADPSVASVHLATPNRLHYPMAKAALLAGKHVMCEKPLAMDRHESAELVEVAAKSGRAAGVNYTVRYNPLVVEAKARYQSGTVGNAFSICGCFVQDWLFKDTDYNWRVLASESGELRAMSDIGTHWLDLIHWVTGLEVEAVCADLSTVHPVRMRPKGEVVAFAKADDIEREPVEITNDDFGSVLLRFEGGARGVLWVSQVMAGQRSSLRFEISGSKCSLAWDSTHPNELWIGHRDRPNSILQKDPALMSSMASRFATYPGGHSEGFADAFRQGFRAFYDYIAAGDMTAKPDYPTFADGHREIVLCDAILKSYREERWVRVSEIASD